MSSRGTELQFCKMSSGDQLHNKVNNAIELYI